MERAKKGSASADVCITKEGKDYGALRCVSFSRK